MELSHVSICFAYNVPKNAASANVCIFLGERGERDNKPEPDPPQTRLSFQISLLSLSLSA
jgi:hypothetical protein